MGLSKDEIKEMERERQIAGAWAKEADEVNKLKALCRQLAEACQMAKAWLEKGLVQEAIQYEDDFETIVPQLESALQAARKAGIIT